MTERNTGHIYTVSKLTREIKTLLEETYPFIWVTGEISNYSTPASGHSYFTLKDQQSVIQAVIFKNQKRNLKFVPEYGMKVMGLARLAVYEPRGSYQLIFEHLEPDGAGAMQIAFEQLKQKLAEQGYFDERHKKPIPFMPSSVCVITSPTGAAVRDIIHVGTRRFPNCRLNIVPVKVQGEGAAEQIVEAFRFANQHQLGDVIILARGGGSMEDLNEFNSEAVAMAIFQSDIPVITGVGHEIDFTIADFAADLRAPTPSAAIEMALPDKKELSRKVDDLEQRIHLSAKKQTDRMRKQVLDLSSRLKSPATVLHDFRFRLEDYEARLSNVMKHCLDRNRDKLSWLVGSLYMRNPVERISTQRQHTKTLTRNLNRHFMDIVQRLKGRHMELSAKLDALNPKEVLKRGYSIARQVPGKKVVKDALEVSENNRIEIILHRGRLITRVEKING